jgi:prepilin-type N-terminal cleavage/methylation domain-containing protein
VTKNITANKGFTLVEMLVSMVLLSMVLLIASSAYSSFSSRWDGRLGHFNRTAMQAKQLILVQEALNSIIAYAVTNETAEAKLYFEGNRNGFVAVTLRSIFNPENAAVMRLQLVQNPDFSYQLIYQESAMVEQLLVKSNQSLNFSQPIVLFDNLSKVDFQYFGWLTRTGKYWTIDSASAQPEPPAWYDEYNSLAINLQPEQVKITFSNEQGDFALQAKLNSTVPGLLNSYADID